MKERKREVRKRRRMDGNSRKKETRKGRESKYAHTPEEVREKGSERERESQWRERIRLRLRNRDRDKTQTWVEEAMRERMK